MDPITGAAIIPPTELGVRVLFFGALAEAIGARERAVEAPPEGLTLEQLTARLAGSDDALLSALGPPTRVAVDQRIAPGNARVLGGQEVAYLPVFSGG